jgi:hypothetical protein
MSEKVGIKFCDFKTDYFKREILLFDRIGIPDLDGAIRHYKENKLFKNSQKASEMEYLIEKEILFDPDKYEWNDKLLSVNEIQHDAKTLAILSDELDRIFNIVEKYKLDPEEQVVSFLAKRQYISLGPQVLAYRVRLACSKLNVGYGFDSYPLFKSADDFHFSLNNPKNETMKIVLNNIPIISDDVSYERIFDFKNDPDTKSKYLGLINWINDISKKDYSQNEITDKIAWLMNEYVRHIELYELKYEVGTWETIITSSTEILENMMKLKFSSIAKSLFSIGKQKTSLLESELNTPGREVAYTIKAKNEFGSVET